MREAMEGDMETRHLINYKCINLHHSSLLDLGNSIMLQGTDPWSVYALYIEASFAPMQPTSSSTFSFVN
jgi:hypothetical protein